MYFTDDVDGDAGFFVPDEPEASDGLEEPLPPEEPEPFVDVVSPFSEALSVSLVVSDDSVFPGVSDLPLPTLASFPQAESAISIASERINATILFMFVHPLFLIIQYIIFSFLQKLGCVKCQFFGVKCRILSDPAKHRIQPKQRQE